MTAVVEQEKTLSEILGKLKRAESPARFLKYCVSRETEDGILLYNLLTKEMVHLSEEEYKTGRCQKYLKTHWFLVPEDANDQEYADFVRWVIETRRKKSEAITGYTIFPTTDCNARCFYCFELGRSRIPMSRETAQKTANYIKNHCAGEKVSLNWFGGEPLYNREAIETICDTLRKEGVEYSSRMTSNGYLLNEETVRKAVMEWKLKRVQITLDGMEEVYNRVKAYIYKGTNPYRRVLENIGHLLNHGVRVAIRLNMDLYNAEDLMRLVEELAERFGGRKGLYVYAHHIFKGNEAMADTHTEEEWEKRTRAMILLEEQIRKHGLEAKRGISKTIKLNHCMADSGKSVTILPDGSIGLCEHYSEEEFIGHIDKEGFDEEAVKSWKERSPELPECAECPLYPECVQLKKCPNGGKCFPALREERLRKTKQAMLYEYEKWKTQAASEESEEAELC